MGLRWASAAQTCARTCGPGPAVREVSGYAERSLFRVLRWGYEKLEGFWPQKNKGKASGKRKPKHLSVRGCLKTPNEDLAKGTAPFMRRKGRESSKKCKANKHNGKSNKSQTEKGKSNYKPAGKSLGINKPVPKRSFWIL